MAHFVCQPLVIDHPAVQNVSKTVQSLFGDRERLARRRVINRAEVPPRFLNQPFGVLKCWRNRSSRGLIKSGDGSENVGYIRHRSLSSVSDSTVTSIPCVAFAASISSERLRRSASIEFLSRSAMSSPSWFPLSSDNVTPNSSPHLSCIVSTNCDATARAAAQLSRR